MIAIVNYGLGNIQAIGNIYNRLEIPFCLASKPEDLRRADRILLPGVGSFDWAMSRLEQSGLRQTLDELVLERKLPVLGICVGMQMMAKRSDEGMLPGLGWLDADIPKFDITEAKDLYLPHMGWNSVVPSRGGGLFAGLEIDARFYFLHSYYFHPYSEQDVLATTEYVKSFASSVAHNNIYGVQFHPEKSHHWGVRLLKNFSEI